ncbi:MAG: hypothetical protein ABI988_02405 [Nitrospirota bacterium]
MPPLKLFLDHWAIVDLLESPSFFVQQERLVSLCKSGACVLVLTIWYVHEALRDGNKDRARDLCAKIEALSKQVPSLWIRLRTEIQEDEIADEFFRSIGARYQKNNPFCVEAVSIFPNHEKLPDIEKARRAGLVWFFSKPELFGEALSEQKKYPAVKAELKAADQATVGGKDFLNEARKQYVKRLLPSRTPGGLIIADQSKREFLQEMDIAKFRAVSFEAGLSEVTTADAQARPTEQDLVDLQHAVSVVPYVDVAVLDGKFCKYASTVKRSWKGAEPLAECFDNIAAALDWIEKKAAKQ